MPYEITNTLRSSSIIRAVDPGTYTVTLANLSANVAQETVNSASIKRVIWSTNGNITISRNSVTLLNLLASGDMPLADLGYSLANNSASPIVITITTGGSVLLEVTKDTQYNPALIGM
jgi:hypothetical protein